MRREGFVSRPRRFLLRFESTVEQYIHEGEDAEFLWMFSKKTPEVQETAGVLVNTTGDLKCADPEFKTLTVSDVGHLRVVQSQFEQDPGSMWGGAEPPFKVFK